MKVPKPLKCKRNQKLYAFPRLLACWMQEEVSRLHSFRDFLVRWVFAHSFKHYIPCTTKGVNARRGALTLKKVREAGS